ncbi:hypothetical protein XFLAVUS301_08560 [Xanthobacter flavus]|uniref:Uncharacterized protein n=1 Tax=Xanthobacter flavus TaxID=281 RepID=A0A9W6FKD4_XANFL|nr:hypothetical protein XFLAVUS301_08560 [Xanthobacter flavus]
MRTQLAPPAFAIAEVEHGTTGRACDDSARKADGCGSPCPASRTVPGGAHSFESGAPLKLRPGIKSRFGSYRCRPHTSGGKG